MILFLYSFIFYSSYFMVSCDSECKNFKTCGQCIGYSHDRCVWCPAETNIDENCRSYSSLNGDEWCSETVYDPDANIIIKSDEQFSKAENDEKAIQFRPQLLKIKARPGIPIEIEMSYKPADDYPLDVYYLIDYSETMKPLVETLKSQGQNILNVLSRTSTNVTLGIGSFIEKPSMPFVDPTLNNNKAYSFRNHLSLTDNMDDFTNALAAPEFAKNYDPPEASLDALMQVMTCTEELGWREKARRIIVLATDSTYHSAGDGKFVGAYVKNDMRCHLKNNMYAEELKFDYPSVSQIRKVAVENQFMIIFAVSPDVESHYQALEKNIPGSKYVVLDTSPALVEMIKEEYLGLLRNMVLSYNIPNFMKFTFNPDCTKPDKCALKHNEEIKFNGTLTINSCPPDKIYNYNISVGPLLLDEKLLIEVEVDCQCDCEKYGERNSTKCSEAGTYQCGVCECNENRSGKKCQCTGTEASNKDMDKCKANPEDSVYCSGHGECRCGKCVPCHKGYNGTYCEYNVLDCPSPGGVPCAGHGRCELGKCTCDKNWQISEDCSCPDNNDACIAPVSKDTCSGNGKCDCGRCICKDKCYGRFCDDCEDVTANRCVEFENYAYCNVKYEKEYCDKEYNQTDTDVILVDKAEIDSPKWYKAKVWCSKIFEDNKKLVFRYYYLSKAKRTFLRIIVQKELEAQNVANVWVTAGSVIGAILVIGLFTLIAWKVLVDYHDKKEYSRFYEECKAAGYDVDNPLYNAPEANFINPAYNPNR